MPTITGTWRTSKGGTYRITIPTRVTGAVSGTEILPAGLYASGALTVTGNDAALPAGLSVPSSAGSVPAGWQPVVEVTLYDGQTERYVLDVSGSAIIDLGTVVLPSQYADPAASLVRGVAGGVAALDAAGYVLDGSGNRVAGSGGAGAVASVNGQTGAVVLGAPDVGAPTTIAFTAHTTNTSNPHATTKAQVGLANADNTSDANKPVSTATANALAAKADLIGGLVPTSQLPAVALTTGQAVTNRAAMLALTNVQAGDIVAITTGADKGTYILQAADPTIFGNWLLLNAPTDVVQTVNGQQGTVVLGYGDVGAASAAQGTKADNAATATALSNEVTRAQTAEQTNATAISNNQTAITQRVPQSRQIANGYGITGGGDLTADRTLGVGLSVASATLAATTGTLTAGQANNILSLGLGLGVWLLSATVSLNNTGANMNADLLLSLPAGMTAAGPVATSGRVNAGPLNLSIDAIITVTAAGSVTMQAAPSGGTGFTALAASSVMGAGPATGMTAVRIA